MHLVRAVYSSIDVVELTKQVVRDLQDQGDEEAKVEFVQAVKQGISPAHKDFFQSQKRLSTIAAKATKPTTAVADGGIVPSLFCVSNYLLKQVHKQVAKIC